MPNSFVNQKTRKFCTASWRGLCGGFVTVGMFNTSKFGDVVATGDETEFMNSRATSKLILRSKQALLEVYHFSFIHSREVPFNQSQDFRQLFLIL
jgi:hypothetical protein